MQLQCFFSLTLLAFTIDEKRITLISLSFYCSNIFFQHPAEALLLCLFVWLANTKRLGAANCRKRHLLWQEGEKHLTESCHLVKRAKRIIELFTYLSLPLSQRYYQTICSSSSDELLIKQPQTFFAFPHILRKVLLLRSSPLFAKLTLTSLLSVTLRLPSVSRLTSWSVKPRKHNAASPEAFLG